MRRICAFALGVGLVAGACGDAATSSTSDAAVAGTLCERTGSTLVELPLPADLEEVFDPVVADGMAAMDAVGLTLGVQCAGSPLYVKGYGSGDLASAAPATAATIYEIGSITKQLVAAEILKLAGQHRLTLADAIGTHLPWLPSGWQPVTLRQLLSHTGGVPDHFAIFREEPDTPFDWTRDYAAAELVEAFLALDDQLIAPPGRRFSYSNTDYVMLAAVIEQVTGRTFASAMSEDLFEPLGMEHTAFCSPELPNLAVGYNIGPEGPEPGPELPASFLSGAAGICSTAGDLVRWTRHLVDGTAVTTEAFEAMSSPATLRDGSTVPYGLGLHLEDLDRWTTIFHEGGTAAFSSWLAYYPDHELTVSVLSNTLGPNMLAIRDLVLDLTEVAVTQ